MTTTGSYSVGEVARIARVSKRTLHHYDELGLVRPSRRSRAGYRLYGKADLERLQTVLFYRELGFKDRYRWHGSPGEGEAGGGALRERSRMRGGWLGRGPAASRLPIRVPSLLLLPAHPPRFAQRAAPCLPLPGLVVAEGTFAGVGVDFYLIQ